MERPPIRTRLRLTSLVPAAGVVILAATWGRSLPAGVAAAVFVVQLAVVAVAVGHAETIGHRLGEPFGTLVLALAVTVIEVALIVALMASEGAAASALARDTVFAAVMVVCNGVVGGVLLLATRRGNVATFNAQGANALLGTVVTLATLTLVLPRFTDSTDGPTFSGTQLGFAAVASTVVYGVFVFVQTVRHRALFAHEPALDPARTPARAAANRAAGDTTRADDTAPASDATPAGHTTRAGESLVVPAVALVIALVTVVGLAKTLSKPIDRAVGALGLPSSFVGVVIALMVLLPESVAAFRAGARGDTQTGVNLALGSALASIGLTIPAVAVASIWLDGPVELGLPPKDLVLLALTTVVSTLTFGAGRATLLHAAHHLTVFAAFVFLAAVP